MASLTCDPQGRRMLQVCGTDGRRCTIRLGRLDARQAEAVKRFVEILAACRVSGDAPDNATAEWLASLPPAIHKRLERAGLVAPRRRRECPTLGEWLQAYIDGRTDVKRGTRHNLDVARKRLIGFFGAERRLDEINAGHAKDFRIACKAQGLSEGTIRRECKRAKQFFLAAVEKEIIGKSPFASMKCGNYADPERLYFVTRAETERVIDACPDSDWKALFALARFGGLRTPSESLRLEWADIDWERGRFTVHACKTEHCADGGIRQVPLFPELLPYLRDCFEQAEPGQVRVIRRYALLTENLRTQAHRIIKRAGLVPWPKTFQNCRSTRETELAQEHPLHVVVKWLGNSQPVAAKHYLQVTDEHFARALQKAQQQVRAGPRTDAQEPGTAESDGERKPLNCTALRAGALACANTSTDMHSPQEDSNLCLRKEIPIS